MFGCSGACFNRAVDCQTWLGLLRSQPPFHGDLIVCVCAEEGGMCVEVLAHTCAFIVQFQINVSVCSDKSTSGWLAYMGHF